MKNTLEVLGFLMIFFTLLPMIRTTKWWIRILDFPRFQIAIFIVAILILYITYIPVEQTFQYIFLAGLSIAFILQARYIYPFTFLSPKPAIRSKEKDPDNTICFMISNIKMSNRNADKYLKIVEKNNPDLILINE